MQQREAKSVDDFEIGLLQQLIGQLMSTITYQSTRVIDEKYIVSTDSSDCGDSNSVGGHCSPKQSLRCLELSPEASFNDFDSALSCTSIESPSQQVTAAGSFGELPVLANLRLRQCPALMDKMKCEMGSRCEYSHGEEDFREILKRMRSGKRYFLLEEYPEVVIFGTCAKNCSALFD